MALFRSALGLAARKRVLTLPQPLALALAPALARPQLPAMRLFVLDQFVALLLGARCRVVGHRWRCLLRSDGQAYYQCRWCRRTKVVG